MRGTDDVMVFRAKCCNPIRGEKIVGYITRGKGVSVHSASCPNVLNLMFDPERRIDVEWDSAGTDQAPYTVRLTMQVEDRKGMLAEISAKVSDINTNITNMEARTGDDQQARIDMTVEIRDVKHLEKVIKSIKGVQGVLGVERTRERSRRRRLSDGTESCSYREHRDRVDLDSHVARQARDLHGRARRRRIDDVAAVDLVHRRESFMSARKTVVRTTCSKPAPAASSSAVDVAHDLFGLGRDVAVDQIAGRGIDRNLSREEQQVAGRMAGRIRPDGLRRVGRRRLAPSAHVRRPW